MNPGRTKIHQVSKPVEMNNPKWTLTRAKTDKLHRKQKHAMHSHMQKRYRNDIPRVSEQTQSCIMHQIT